MNTDELIENIRNWPELIRARGEGKEIQWYDGCGWFAEEEPPECWAADVRRRIAPEPAFAAAPAYIKEGDCFTRYPIHNNKAKHYNQIEVYGDEALRDRILDFLNSEDA